MLLVLLQHYLLSTFSYFCVPWTHSSTLWHLLSISLALGSTKRSWLVSYTPSPSPKIGHFSKDLWALLLENVIRKQDIGNG